MSLSKEELETIINSYDWIKVKKYQDNSDNDWEGKYSELMKHHTTETEFLIEKVRSLAQILLKLP